MNNTRKIYDLASLSTSGHEYIGQEAAQLVSLIAAEILIPQTYLITTRAFDEYIQDNDFFDFILEKLAEIENNPRAVKKNAKEIQKKFLEGKISKSLNKELLEMYKKLSGLSKVAVEIQPSFLNKSLAESYASASSYKSIYGVDSIIDTIKQVWANLFSEEALLYREQARYEGPLSLPVLIKKDPMVEVSVLVDTVSPLTVQDNIELEAIVGNIAPLLEGKLIGDRYIYSLKEDVIKEKNITEQEWMEVYRFTKNKFKKEKIDISKVWKSKPKLSDNQIVRIGSIIKRLKSLFDNTATVVLGVEMGRIIVLSITQQVYEEPETEPRVEAISHLDILRQKLETEVEPVDNQTIATSPAVTLITEEPEEVETEVTQIEDEKQMEEVQPINKISTVVDVYSLDFDDTVYKKYSKNIEGLLSLSGDNFVQKSREDYQELIRQKTQTVDKIVDYIAEIAGKVEVPIIYTFASEIYREDFGSPFGASRISGGQSLAEIELEAIRVVRNKRNMKNVWLAIPFIRDINEFLEVKKLIFLSKLRRSPSLKIFAVIDNASSALLIEDLDEAGVDGLIYNLDSLSKNTLGFFIPGKTPAPGIVKLLEASMKQAGDYKIKSIASGKSIGISYDLKTLIPLGFTAVAVKIEQVEETKNKIREIEKSKFK